MQKNSNDKILDTNLEQSSDQIQILESEENSWLDEIILEQEEDLLDDDWLINKIPNYIAGKLRDDEIH